MILKGEKTAWLVILACTAAIAVLLIISAGRTKTQAQTSLSHLSSQRSPASVSSNTSSATARRLQPPNSVIQSTSQSPNRRSRRAPIVKAQVTVDPGPLATDNIPANAEGANVGSSELLIAKDDVSEEEKRRLRRERLNVALVKRMLRLESIGVVAPTPTGAPTTDGAAPPIETSPEEQMAPRLSVKILYTETAIRRIDDVESLTESVYIDMARFGNTGRIASVTYQQVEKQQIRELTDIKSLYLADYVYIVTERGRLRLLAD